MLATDIMRKSFATIKSTASVLDAVRLLLETDQRGLPVINDSGDLIGIVSEGDLLHRDELGISAPKVNWLEAVLGIEENNPERARMRTLQVEALMSTSPVKVDSDASVDDVVAQMDLHNIGQVPVVSAGIVIGIVSRKELLVALERRLSQQAETETNTAGS